jgi:hypothetical protein
MMTKREEREKKGIIERTEKKKGRSACGECDRD